eukprot:2329498-Rhodomonas_salina.2
MTEREVRQKKRSELSGRDRAEEKRRGEKTVPKKRAKRESSNAEEKEGKPEKVGKKLKGKEVETVAIRLRRRRRVPARWARESPEGAVTLQRCPKKSLLHHSSVVSEAFARVEATLWCVCQGRRGCVAVKGQINLEKVPKSETG